MRRPLIACSTPDNEPTTLSTAYMARVFIFLTPDEKITLLSIVSDHILVFIRELIAAHGIHAVERHFDIIGHANMHYYMIETQKWELFPHVIKCRIPNDALIKLCQAQNFEYFGKYRRHGAPVSDQLVEYVIAFMPLCYYIELDIQTNAFVMQKISEYGNMELYSYLHRKRLRLWVPFVASPQTAPHCLCASHTNDVRRKKCLNMPNKKNYFFPNYTCDERICVGAAHTKSEERS